MASKRRSNGDGTYHQRPDGRWCGRGVVHLLEGGTKRIAVYGATRREAQDKLLIKLSSDRRGAFISRREQNVATYLDSWFETVVRASKKVRTQEFYESAIRLYLKPTFGEIKLAKFSVQDAQRGFNKLLAAGNGVRTVQKTHQTLRAALTQAEREDLIVRNVARHVVLPAYTKKPIVPWTVEQQRIFLATAQGHPWFGAYVLLLNYGLRRGEVLGLRYCDIDLDNGVIYIRQQLQRIAGQGLTVGTTKTAAGQRALPLSLAARDALPTFPAVPSEATAARFLFSSKAGGPVDPKNFVRAFHRIRERAGLPFITVHHLRHSAATTMKNIGAAAADAQSILGHAHVTTTMQIYQHSDPHAQLHVLDRIGTALTDATGTQTGTPDPAQATDVGSAPLLQAA